VSPSPYSLPRGYPLGVLTEYYLMENTIKNIIRLEQYYSPEELVNQIAAFFWIITTTTATLSPWIMLLLRKYTLDEKKKYLKDDSELRTEH